MGNFGFQELLVIAVVALLVFGPDRLPELARQAGRLVSRFREETSKGMAELKRAAEVEDLDRELRAMRDELGHVGREFSGVIDRTGGELRDVARPRHRGSPPPTDPDAT